MVQLFVPVARAALAAPVRGLHFEPTTERPQRDLALRFADQAGTFLAGAGAQGCLCGFSDWAAVAEIARDLAQRNAAPFIAVLSYTAGSRYDLIEREVDIDDDAPCAQAAHGALIVLHNGPVEQRRHHRIVRALVGAVGTEVVLRLKGGQLLRGTLGAFDAASEVGAVGTRTFVAAQVHELADR